MVPYHLVLHQIESGHSTWTKKLLIKLQDLITHFKILLFMSLGTRIVGVVCGLSLGAIPP